MGHLNGPLHGRLGQCLTGDHEVHADLREHLRVLLGSVGSEADLAAALTSLLADANRRRQLSAAGIERAAGYTWTAAAKAHQAVFDAQVNG